jgi:hypothetical protein
VAKVVLLVALALIVSSIQCAAACTPASYGAPQPPCHHHKQPPKASCHELIPATTNQPFVVSVLFSAEPVDESPISGADIQVLQHASPPILTVPPLTVLRI